MVRYLSANGKDVIPRAAGVWTTKGTAARMIAALNAAGRPAPQYLHFVAGDSSRKTQTAEFAMHCYWEGEAKLGSINGVSSTRSGWRNNLEVVRVQYDPSLVDYKTLLTEAQKFDCASKVFAHTDSQLAAAMQAVGKKKSERVSGNMRDAKASDQKYYLLQTPARYLPMTELQATKVNSLIGSRKSVANALSPRQQKLLVRISEVLKKDKTALAGLKVPTDTSDFHSYQAKLESKLKAPATAAANK